MRSPSTLLLVPELKLFLGLPGGHRPDGVSRAPLSFSRRLERLWQLLGEAVETSSELLLHMSHCGEAAAPSSGNTAAPSDNEDQPFRQMRAALPFHLHTQGHLEAGGTSQLQRRSAAPAVTVLLHHLHHLHRCKGEPAQKTRGLFIPTSDV